MIINTGTWTRLCSSHRANIKIIEVMMGLPSEVLVQQALHGEFNRMLIERVNPDSLKLISKEKNYQQMAQL